MVLVTCTCALFLLSPSLLAQENSRKSPEYILEMNLFIEDYDAALFTISAIDDSANINEIIDLQEKYESLMEKSRTHFRKLLDLTPEGKDKEIMRLMYEQLKTED